MSKWKKRVLIIIAAVVLAGLAAGGKYMLDLQNYKSEVAGIQIGDIDLKTVPDGSYKGSYDVDFIEVEVQVHVKDHQISDIALIRHKNGEGAPAEAIIPEVIRAQSLDVDTVSGATNSSKLILKSIEMALQKGAGRE